VKRMGGINEGSGVWVGIRRMGERLKGKIRDKRVEPKDLGVLYHGKLAETIV